MKMTPPAAAPGLFSKLSREGRDTLFLLATIAAIVAPHGGHLPLWASAITALMLAWRGWLAWHSEPLPGRWVLVAVLLISAGLTWITHRTLIGREAGITLLVMLMALKTLELRARRDAFVVFFLGFFLVLTNFLYSQSLFTALWTLLSVWALLSAVVLAQMPVGQPSLALAAKQAARTTLYGLPVMVLLFVLFPRIGPLWGVPADSIGRTGLSNRLDFGAMSEIANDDSIAMRLRFQGAPPAPQARYFRGPVLAQFDGKTWRPSPLQWPGRPDPLQTEGEALSYELTLEPLRLSVIPLLEMSPEPAGTERDLEGLTIRRSAELQWSAERPITERVRLTARAYSRYRHGPNPAPGQAALVLQNYLDLPAGYNPRTLAWAADLRRQPQFAQLNESQLTPALAQAVLQHIASADFTYTLAPGRYGEDTLHLIDEFWFDRRLGFCEHFSAAFVVVMRAMGVPARIVTGFQGMDPQPQDDFWIVRNSNAHAWAEYWTPHLGWQRADPTAAIAPDRILQGLALRPAPGAFAGALGQINPTLLLTLRRAWETLDNRWQQSVLNYSRQSQFDLLKTMGFESPDWQLLGKVSAVLIGLLALLGAAWSAWLQRPHDAWSRQRSRILSELHRLGVADAAPHQGPAQWARLLSQTHGNAAEPAARLLLRLEQARYAPDAGEGLSYAARRRWWREFRAAGRMLRRKMP
ncbi:transglutaminaseTgpA domain-containing protein [Roseateles sp.]|uniref:transglutaminase family protein n=1 Tax=Roseateles sp. TaxID=1971397 RepID=UPI003BA45C51